MTALDDDEKVAENARAISKVRAEVAAAVEYLDRARRILARILTRLEVTANDPRT